MSESRKIRDFDIKAPSIQLKTFVHVIIMSEKRTRLSNREKCHLEAIRIPGYKKEDIMKKYIIWKKQPSTAS